VETDDSGRDSARRGIASLGSSDDIVRALTANTPVGIFLSSSDGRCEFVNNRWCELAGLAFEEALGDGWAGALHPDDADRVGAEWAAAAEAERDSVIEYRFLRRDGSVAWVQGYATRLRDDDGSPIGWVGTCLDLTARREAEAALVSSSERFRVAFDNAPIGVALLTPDGRWFQVNRALCDLLGYSADELRELTFGDITHPDDLASNLERSRRQLAGEEWETRIEKRYIRSDGGVVWVALSNEVVRAADGQTLYFVALIEDITQRRETELALQEADERFRRAFDDAPIGMALVSTEGRFLRVNRTLYEILGYEEPRLLDLTFQQITHPDDLETDLDQVQRVLSGELGAYKLEKRYTVEDGRVIWAMLSVSLVRDNDGTPLYFVSQIEDITDRKAAERELERLAYHDPLTGLLNRRRFGETLEHELARMRRYGGLAALLVIDVDRFKRVNDSIGHKAGDDVLCAVAETLRRRLRATDVVARLGGDEFAVLAIEVASAEQARTIAADIAEAIRSQSIITSGRAVEVTVSIGVAMLDAHDGTTEDRAFVAADDAMYQAKRSGRDRIALAA
jgi:diguanylate cyclase (GGDEF)-like protein/PAS domain S-box-containing protein